MKRVVDALAQLVVLAGLGVILQRSGAWVWLVRWLLGAL